MTNETERKVDAALTIGYGLAKCASGVALTLGHGLLSIAIRSPGARLPIARGIMESGGELVKKGMKKWNE